MPLQCNRRLQTILLHKKRSHLSVIRYYWLIYVRSKYKFVLCNISLKQQGLLVIVVALYCSWERRAWITEARFEQLSGQDGVSRACLIEWCNQICVSTWFSPFVAMESALWHLSACAMPTAKLGGWAREASGGNSAACSRSSVAYSTTTLANKDKQGALVAPFRLGKVVRRKNGDT